MFQPPEELIQYVRQAREILVVSHIAPDGDAVGSVLGIGALLRQIGKSVVLAMQDPVPDSLTYLPMSGSITNDPYGSFDLVVGLDASSPDRFGNVYREEYASLPLVVIDHHITNTNFGTVNWVEPRAVATAELIFDLVNTMKARWTVEMALPLLNGLVTDTLCFRTPNVVPRTLEVAADLMKAGASLPLVTENALSRKPLAVVRLWARTLPTVDLRGKIIYAEVPYQVRQSVGDTEGDSGGLVNFLISVKEAEVGVLFTEREPETVDVSMRSRRGVDVSQVAFQMGGGGHPQAAGCTLKGRLLEVREAVLNALVESLQAQGVM